MKTARPKSRTREACDAIVESALRNAYDTIVVEKAQPLASFVSVAIATAEMAIDDRFAPPTKADARYIITAVIRLGKRQREKIRDAHPEL